MFRKVLIVLIVVVAIVGLNCKKVGGKPVEPEDKNPKNTFVIESFSASPFNEGNGKWEFDDFYIKISYYCSLKTEAKFSLFRDGKEKIREGSFSFGPSNGEGRPSEIRLSINPVIVDLGVVGSIFWKVVVELPEGFREPRVQEKTTQNFILEAPLGDGGDQ